MSTGRAALDMRRTYRATLDGKVQGGFPNLVLPAQGRGLHHVDELARNVEVVRADCQVQGKVAVLVGHLERLHGLRRPRACKV